MSLMTLIFGHTRSFENPNTSLSDPAEWLKVTMGGGQSISGMEVNYDSALSYSPVWRAVNLIASDVAKLPLVVYERDGSGKKRAKAHPAFKLLRHRPNTEMGFFTFKKTIQAQALLWGNGYALINRKGSGAPAELFLLDAAKTRPLRKNKILFYETEVNNQKVIIPADNVFHVSGMGNGLEGDSVISRARNSFGLGMAAQKYGNKFFANNGKPNIALEHPQTLSDKAYDRIKESWDSNHVGLENAHKPAILEEGMKIHEYSMSNEDAQFLQTRQFEIREVANWFGVPPHKLGDTTRTAFASLEQENQSYLDEALDPWLVAWESECWLKLLRKNEQDQDTHAIEFVRNALVRANMKDRGEFYNKAITTGWMSRDEARSKENMNPMPNGEGEKFIVPMNMTVLGEENDPETKGQRAEQSPLQPFAPMLLDAFQRMTNRITNQAGREYKKKTTYEDWVESKMAESNASPVASIIGPAIEVIRQLRETELNVSDISDLFFKQARSQLRSMADCQEFNPETMKKVPNIMLEAMLKQEPNYGA